MISAIGVSTQPKWRIDVFSICHLGTKVFPI